MCVKARSCQRRIVVLLALYVNLLIYPSRGQLTQCFNTRQCKVQAPTFNVDNAGTRLTKPIACEPRNERGDVASLGRISVSPENATCRTPDVQICSLQNRISCFKCDASRDDKRHEPDHMIDGISWTWWQSVTWPGSKDSRLTVNVTLTLPKVFILTDDIMIEFYEGRPQAMIVDKSSDYGVTWQPLQYFADDCMKQFGIKRTAINTPFKTVGEALAPFCSEDYSRNYQWDLTGFVPVAIAKRLNALTAIGLGQDEVCSAMWNDTIGLKSFLEITGLRIRLLSPAVLHSSSKKSLDDPDTEKETVLPRSDHYGIKKIEISARCQCNGHASTCTTGTKTARCDCQHNTMGNECEKCESLFWIEKWKPGMYVAGRSQGKGNPCLSYFSAWYREKLIREGRHRPGDRIPPTKLPAPCQCNKHSHRCEIIDKMGVVCVDCRHNTEGQNCHNCRQTYFRNPDMSLHDPNVCQRCNCSRLGSYSRWCGVNGQCHCKHGFGGRTCGKCREGFYMYQNHCYKIKSGCVELWTKKCRESFKNVETCTASATQWCVCKTLKTGECDELPSSFTRPSPRRASSTQSPGGAANSLRASLTVCTCLLFVANLFTRLH